MDLPATCSMIQCATSWCRPPRAAGTGDIGDHEMWAEPRIRSCLEGLVFGHATLDRACPPRRRLGSSTTSGTTFAGERWNLADVARTAWAPMNTVERVGPERNRLAALMNEASAPTTDALEDDRSPDCRRVAGCGHPVREAR